MLSIKKSLLLLSSLMLWPAFILCALVMISLSAACLKISLNLTTLNFSEPIMSFKTFPGPTLGSWLTSPTRMSLVPTVTAFSREYIRYMSTIDISSMIITSASRGLSSFLSKRIEPPSSGLPFSSKSL